MKRWVTSFALLALLPAAVNAAALPPREGQTIALCTGDGVTRTVPLPGAPRDDGQGHCAKGCHAGCSRKRGGVRP